MAPLRPPRLLPIRKTIRTRESFPRGVKFNETEAAGTVKFDKNSPFAKKSNKTNMIFIVVGIVLGLVIVAGIVMAFMNVGGE